MKDYIIVAGLIFCLAFSAASYSNTQFGAAFTDVATSDTVQTLRLRVNNHSVLWNNFGTTTNNTWTGTQIFSQTSTTTWAGGVQIDGGGFQVSTLTSSSCDLKADSSGNFYCGSDNTGTFAWPFTIGSYNSQVTSATTTLLHLTGSPLSLAASSSDLTYASSTALTATNLFGGTLVLTNDLAVSQGGTGLSTFGGTNTILFTSAADTLTSDTDLTYNGTNNLLTLVNATGTQATFTRLWATHFAQPIASSTDASAVRTIDWSAGNTQRLILSANTLLVINSTSSNPLDGGKYIVKACQDPTGSRTLSFVPVALRWGNGTTTISSAAGTCSMIGMIYDGSRGIYNVVASSTGMAN